MFKTIKSMMSAAPIRTENRPRDTVHAPSVDLYQAGKLKGYTDCRRGTMSYAAPGTNTNTPWWHGYREGYMLCQQGQPLGSH